jgi:hypothetical protein
MPFFNLCYTDINSMETNSLAPTRLAWPGWSGFLRKYRLEGMAAFVLEAAGQLAILGAQVIHLSSPLLQPLLDQTQPEALSSLLEDRAESLAFAAYLREENPCE